MSKYADWFQEMLDQGLSMVSGEMDPQKFERRAYDGHISYEVGGTDGRYVPDPFDVWVVQFRKSPVNALYYGNDNRHILAPYVKAYQGWVVSLDATEPVELPSDRVPHPPVWPNYIDNPSSEDSDQGAPDVVLDEAEECELCGEPADGETGSFLKDGEIIVAHSQCGIDEGLDLA